MFLLSSLQHLLVYLRLQLYFVPRRAFVHLLMFLRSMRDPLPSYVQVVRIPRPSGGKIVLHLYPPSGSRSGTTPNPGGTGPGPDPAPQPVHINIHGGGFCLPFHGIDRPFCTLVARSARCWVVDANYRDAPSHPFPAAYEDVLHVLAWVRARGSARSRSGESESEFNFDPERITLGGFSAGANLALAVVGSLPQESKSESGCVKGVVAFYPVVDFSVSYSEKPAPAVSVSRMKLPRERGRVVPPSQGEMFNAAYLRSLLSRTKSSSAAGAGNEVLKDPRLSPLFAPPDQFPSKGRTMILACSEDFLGSEALQMARALERAGREPEVVWLEGWGHGWDKVCPEGSEGARVRDVMWERAVRVIRRAQGQDERELGAGSEMA